MEIKLVNIEKVNQEHLKYLVDIQIGEIITRQWRVVSSGGKTFVAAPQVTFYDESGKGHRQTLISVPPNIRESVEHLIFSSIANNGGNNNGIKEKE